MSEKKKRCLPIILGLIIVTSISSACNSLPEKSSTKSTEQTPSVVESINDDNESKPTPKKTITTTVTENTSPSEIGTTGKFTTTNVDITEKKQLTTSTKATLKTAATTTKKKKTTTKTTTSTAASTTKKKKKTTTTTTKATTTTTTTTTVTTQATTTTTYMLRTYIINWNSYIVHKPSCRTLEYSDTYWPDHYEYVENLDIDWANANGFRACKVCTPIWHN